MFVFHTQTPKGAGSIAVFIFRFLRYYKGIMRNTTNTHTASAEDDAARGVKRAISLALLEKDADARERLEGEVEKILAFVGEVQSVATDNTAQANGKVNVFRDDVVTVEAGVYREDMLAQAPASFKKWFLSKKIL